MEEIVIGTPVTTTKGTFAHFITTGGDRVEFSFLTGISNANLPKTILFLTNKSSECNCCGNTITCCKTRCCQWSVCRKCAWKCHQNHTFCPNCDYTIPVKFKLPNYKLPTEEKKFEVELKLPQHEFDKFSRLNDFIMNNLKIFS